MKIKIFCAFAPLALMVTLRLSASTYYISPSGADDNAGTSTSAPWKTFGHAIPLLNAGDTLYLLNGTYTGANSGYPQINCSSGARNGTSFAPITIQALNERQAFIQGNGSSANPFYLTTCSYWNIVGLHVEDGDFSSQSSSSGGVIDIAS